MKRANLRHFWLLAVAVAAAAAGAGCEVIVGATPASVSCSVTSSLPNECPGGQTCVDGICSDCPGGRCVVILDSGVDVVHLDAPHEVSVDVVLHDAPPDVVVDTGHDVAMETAPMGELGDTCTGDTACSSGLCATQTDLPMLPGNACSKTCCADTDCGGGFTCYPTLGGNLCVSTTLAGCRGATPCPTPCCGTMGCGGSDSCSFVDGGGAPSCNAYGGDDSLCSSNNGAGGDGCDVDSDCQSGLCLQTGEGVCDDTCTGPCCQDSDCSSDGSQTCQWVEITDQEDTPIGFVRTCAQPSGSKKTGSECSSDMQCTGNVCAVGVCTGPCCTDTDCMPLGDKWKCLPYNTTLAGTIPLLVCQETT